MDFLVQTCRLLGRIITQSLAEDCPSLTSGTVDIVCECDGLNVSCEYPIHPGTKAKLNCKPLYEYSTPVHYSPYKEVTCLENGTWDRPLSNCVPECGKTTAPGYATIVGGSDAELGSFPWHVAVYYRDIPSTKVDQICGGSLISPGLVISAAHCFYNFTTERVQGATNYLIAAGKIQRSYYEYEVQQQKSQVQQIHIPYDFNGLRGFYAEDIAVLRLERPFTITTFVRAVCLDWNNTFTREHLRSGQSGKVMGWGITVAGIRSERHQEITLPYIDHNHCRTKAPTDFKVLITDDKICAGYLTGLSICHGDSGGGLCFRSDDRWYLRGIVSVISLIDGGTRKQRCNNHNYSAFTNVENFKTWIQRSASANSTF